jgi:hypothetical protein
VERVREQEGKEDGAEGRGEVSLRVLSKDAQGERSEHLMFRIVTGLWLAVIVLTIVTKDYHYALGVATWGFCVFVWGRTRREK